MDKKHFFVKLIPPRPTFAMDMTDDERRLMGEHGQYTMRHFAAGKILIFGPVMAADSVFGMAVFEVDDISEVRQILDNDPTTLAGLNTYEVSPMHVGAAQAKGAKL